MLTAPDIDLEPLDPEEITLYSGIDLDERWIDRLRLEAGEEV